MTRRIATLRFTPADQRAFARWSGDFNPVHLDPVAARLVAAGEPIVHGAHLLLSALNVRFDRRLADTDLMLTVRFHRPALLGEQLDVIQIDRNTTTIVAAGGTELVEIRVERATPSDRDFSSAIPRANGSVRPPRAPRVMTIDDMMDASGSLPAPVSAGLRRAFPSAFRSFGSGLVGAVAGLSRLVGMECPGRDSLLSALTLRVRPHAAISRLGWRVARVDRRFGLVRIDVDGDGVSGTVDAFVRPAPPAAPDFESVAALVRPGEFAGQRALVVGGSRGLGAVAAMLVAAGSGAVLVTYSSGAAEAAALRRTAKALGRHFATQHLDVLDATAADLAKAAARFKPTHLYYFATPRIFGRRRDPFDIDLFQRFVSFYVTGFVRVCSAVAANSRPLRVFFPSSTALDEGARELVEYSAAKAAGELACRGLDSAAANLQITVERLPRVATGQTASIVRARAADPCTVMLPIVRRLHASG